MGSLTDEELVDKLRSYGYEPGPVTPSTRQVYERKLERLINDKGSDSKPKFNRTSKPLHDHTVRNEEIISRPLNVTVIRASVNRGLVGNGSDRTEMPEIHNEPLVPSQETFYSNTSPTPQQNPGHTPNASIRPPLRTVNADVPYGSPANLQNELRVRSKSSNTNSTPVQFSNRDDGLTSRYFQSGGSGISPRHGDVSSLGNSRVSHDRSFWSGWISNRSESRTGVLSDEPTVDLNNVVNGASDCASQSGTQNEPYNTSISQVSWASVGNHVPNIILFCGIVLIAVITSSYFLLKDRHSNIGKMADLQKIVCTSEERCDQNLASVCSRRDCVSAQNLPLVLQIIHSLFEILSRFAGEHACGESVESPRMEVETAKRLVKSHYASQALGGMSSHKIDALWNDVLLLVTEVGTKHLKIAAFDAEGSHPSSPHDVQELESLRPYLPGGCRLRLLVTSVMNFLQNLLWLLLIVVCVGCVCFGIYRVKLSRTSRAKQRSLRVRQIVREVVGILQEQLQRRLSSPPEPPYMPVTWIRERLKRTNPDLEDLWAEVEQHVHLVEGGIVVQEWRGIGETWQWQTGSGWQGSAISNASQKLPFSSPPTECLKIRNMFTADSLDPLTSRRLKREILNHVAGVGSVLHIGLDTQKNQGLVYLKCASNVDAGRIFEIINANYFDSHLLTVKFLHASKYYLRFPDARTAMIPMKSADFL